jgi:acetoin utilization deacetylase AcuC-like enzyme
LDHQTPSGHPERSDRIRVINDKLKGHRFEALLRDEAPEADQVMLERCHPPAYIQAIKESCPASGIVQLDADTWLSPGSWEAMLRGAGAATHAVDQVMSGRVRNAFAAIRPPGHHAEQQTAMGFCFFNNAAIAARHAQAVHGIERVAIIDWDVHHGNGTQDIFWSDPSVLYVSTHEMPLYPGTGAADETGAFGTILNVPMQAGDGSEAFRAAFDDVVLPRLHEFRPDFLIISAGFDAHRDDPLGNLQLDEADFTWATRQLMALADVHAHGRIVSVLEGGYDLQGLALSVAAHVEALMGGDVGARSTT